VILILIGGLIDITNTFDISETIDRIDPEDEGDEEAGEDIEDSQKSMYGGSLLSAIGKFIGFLGINCIGLGFLFKTYKSISGGKKTIFIIGNSLLFIGIILALVSTILSYNASIDNVDADEIDEIADAWDTFGYSSIIGMIGSIFVYSGIGLLALGGALILIMKRPTQQPQQTYYQPIPPKNEEAVSIHPKPNDERREAPRPPRGFAERKSHPPY